MSKFKITEEAWGIRSYIVEAENKEEAKKKWRYSTDDVCQAIEDQKAEWEMNFEDIQLYDIEEIEN